MIVTGLWRQAPLIIKQEIHWTEALLNTQYAKQWRLSSEEFLNAETMKAMHNGKAVAVSDGSFMQGVGTAAWTIKGADQEGRYVGNSLPLGNAINQSALQ